MAIQEETFKDIYTSFNMGPDNQLLGLSEEEMVLFWNWFRENAVNYEISDNLDKELIGKENVVAGRCFGNSQEIAIEENKNYCEGFMKSKDGFIMHGYNIDKNLVEDYTVKSYVPEFTDINGNLPSEYYGIIIPNAFVEKLNGENLKNGKFENSCLIAQYFRSTRE
jgi:hypothetical protein